MAMSTSTTTTAAMVVTAATAGRTAKVAVERRHVLGVARGALAEIAVITVCHGIFLRLMFFASELILSEVVSHKNLL